MSEEFSFCDLRELFAKANEEKSGDQLAGLAARSEPLSVFLSPLWVLPFLRVVK